MEHLANFKSSNIEAAEYDPAHKMLSVEFKNSSHRYHYKDVQIKTWEGLKKAESKGGFLHKHIQTKHDHVKVPKSI